MNLRYLSLIKAIGSLCYLDRGSHRYIFDVQAVTSAAVARPGIRIPYATVFAVIAFFAASSRPALCSAPSSCAKLIPPGGVVDTLRTSSNEELHEFLDDYTYKKNYGTEDDAINDGFSVGFPVYGIPVQVGGHWDETKKKAWFDEYEHRTKHQLDSSKAAQFESIKQNVEAIRLITYCMETTEGYGVIGTLDQVSDCSATFTAWYRSSQDDAPPLKLATPALKVQGGSCDSWPKKTIGNSPATVNCKRNGRDALVVTIRTSNGPSKSDHIDALPSLGPEPTGHDVYADVQTKPATKDFVLYHKDFTKWNGAGTDLGDYRFTFYTDLPAPTGGKVQSAEVTSASGVGAHFWFCPGPHGYCPHPLFEPVNNGLSLFGGLFGSGGSSMRLWAYRDSDSPSIELHVTLHYFATENKCVSQCGADQARANWEAEKARTCPAVNGAQAVPGLQ